MNRADARALVMQHTGRKDTATVNATLLINQAINLARRAIQQYWDFQRTRVTAADVALSSGTSVVALESSVLKVISPVTLVNPANELLFYPIDLRAKAWVRQRYPNLNKTIIPGQIYVCYVEGTNLVFVPPPIQDWTVRYEYFAAVPDLTGDLDLEPGLDDAIICWATSYVFKSTQQRSESQAWAADFAVALKLVIAGEVRDREATELSPFQQPVPADQMTTIPPWLNPFVR